MPIDKLSPKSNTSRNSSPVSSTGIISPGSSKSLSSIESQQSEDNGVSLFTQQDQPSLLPSTAHYQDHVLVNKKFSVDHKHLTHAQKTHAWKFNIEDRSDNYIIDHHEKYEIGKEKTKKTKFRIDVASMVTATSFALCLVLGGAGTIALAALVPITIIFAVVILSLFIYRGTINSKYHSPNLFNASKNNEPISFQIPRYVDFMVEDIDKTQGNLDELKNTLNNTMLILEEKTYPNPPFNYKIEGNSASGTQSLKRKVIVTHDGCALAKEQIKFQKFNALILRKLSIINGVVTMLTKSEYFLSKEPVKRDKLTKALEEFSKKALIEDTDLNKFVTELCEEIHAVTKLDLKKCIRKVRNAERYFIAEFKGNTDYVTLTILDDKVIKQEEISYNNQLTQTQKESYLKIHSNNPPTWFTNRELWEQDWLKSFVPKPKDKPQDWSKFSRIMQSCGMQHLPGIKNARTVLLSVSSKDSYDKNENKWKILSSNFKMATISPYEMPKTDRVIEAKNNIDQSVEFLKEQAQNNFQTIWGNISDKVPNKTLIFMQSLLSDTFGDQVTRGGTDSKLNAQQTSVIQKWQEENNDKNNMTFIFGNDSLNAFRKTELELSIIRPQTTDVLIKAQDFVLSLEKIGLNSLTPLQLKKFQTIKSAKAHLENLGQETFFTQKGRNLSLYKVAYQSILIEAMGGVVSTNCKSGKDRTGIEGIIRHAMLLYADNNNGKLPNYKTPVNESEEYLKYTETLFHSGSAQHSAGNNTPGSIGLKDNTLSGITCSDIVAKLGESYLSSYECARFNKPNIFTHDEQKEKNELKQKTNLYQLPIVNEAIKKASQDFNNWSHILLSPNNKKKALSQTSANPVIGVFNIINELIGFQKKSLKHHGSENFVEAISAELYRKIHPNCPKAILTEEGAVVYENANYVSFRKIFSKPWSEFVKEIKTPNSVLNKACLTIGIMQEVIEKLDETNEDKNFRITFIKNIIKTTFKDFVAFNLSSVVFEENDLSDENIGISFDDDKLILKKIDGGQTFNTLRIKDEPLLGYAEVKTVKLKTKELTEFLEVSEFYGFENENLPNELQPDQFLGLNTKEVRDAALARSRKYGLTKELFLSTGEKSLKQRFFENNFHKHILKKEDYCPSTLPFFDQRYLSFFNEEEKVELSSIYDVSQKEVFSKIIEVVTQQSLDDFKLETEALVGINNMRQLGYLDINQEARVDEIFNKITERVSTLIELTHTELLNSQTEEINKQMEQIDSAPSQKNINTLLEKIEQYIKIQQFRLERLPTKFPLKDNSYRNQHDAIVTEMRKFEMKKLKLEDQLLKLDD